MLDGRLRRTDWLPVRGDPAAEQVDRSYDSLSDATDSDDEGGYRSEEEDDLMERLLGGDRGDEDAYSEEEGWLSDGSEDSVESEDSSECSMGLVVDEHYQSPSIKASIKALLGRSP